jgi:hypothetical protein
MFPTKLRLEPARAATFIASKWRMKPSSKAYREESVHGIMTVAVIRRDVSREHTIFID